MKEIVKTGIFGGILGGNHGGPLTFVVIKWRQSDVIDVLRDAQQIMTTKIIGTPWKKLWKSDHSGLRPSNN